ncbi:L,D-transpeptidase [Aureimonas endophytica]|uniref:L,D-transpeptidase n=1 Tax=Aureimonas endophytica TaxID=2027858 RepID=A0A917E068_9HYPH|nr:L,D-transpeptidase [Aureimonas endophytica]GGD86627.1 L,D-transpeptidase [Aureimonas endophytica]
MSRWIVSALAGLGLFASALEAEAGGRLVAFVSIAEQTMTVSYDGSVVDRWPVSTARRGYSTPTGSYRPFRLSRMWYSKKYDNSPMPHSIFFRGGYAIHGTGSIRSLGRPASHGCVRLHPQDAATLYSMVRDVGLGNTEIVITR